MAKRKLKNPIKFDIQLNEEQKAAKSDMLGSNCTVLNGLAGTAKTFLSVNVALDLLFKGEVHKIYCTRPPIELQQFNKIGALPGDAASKMEIYMAPFMDAFKSNYYNTESKKRKLEKMFSDGQIEFLALPYIRGMNLGNSNFRCVVLVDEAQNADDSTMYAILTRMGEGSKLFITVDPNQEDISGKSGVSKLLALEGKVPDFKVVNLKHNFRSKFVQAVSKYWNNEED